ncbi:MAG TPA: hypothetical protein VFK71_02890 [Gaiellaceae bacterium]|nr:hypothetical protein [Gaiellaceae bacterium]
MLLLAVLLVAGCGSNRSAAQKQMDARFDSIDYSMANLETLTAAYGPNLRQATQRYIGLVRQYAHLLGANEARKRLTEKGDEVGPYCLSCAASLYDEAKRY